MTMLSVAEARAKARKRLNSSMAAWAAEAVNEVRLEIALRPPTEKQVLADQTAAADWAASWRAGDEKATTAGLDIDWQDRSWARSARPRRGRDRPRLGAAARPGRRDPAAARRRGGRDCTCAGRGGDRHRRCPRRR